MSFCRASKYVIWLGVKTSHLLGRLNITVGQVCKSAFSDHQTIMFCAWNGEDKFENFWKIYLLKELNLKYHCVGHKEISYK